MATVIFGKNILENLTTAMYSDSRIMFREYVQNSCDAIRVAANTGIISQCDAQVHIKIGKVDRSIEITDNGSGISKADFERVLSDIANSDKVRGEDMGFRGIGRLCGLAYCTQMQFISTAYGETNVCTMTWDAETMRTMLDDNKKYTAEEVLGAIKRVDYQDNATKANDHYFKVIMSGIRYESEALLDVSDIRNYLSFVAPVPYSTKFLFYNKIYDHAKELGECIDEYRIYVNDEQIFKNYTSRIYTKGGEVHDEIKALEFRDFDDDNGNLLAWMWFGVSAYDGSIPDCERNLHRGLRLRRANIQIGDEDTLRKLHKEPRGNGYFVGELFAAHRELTPNARRDYFNENPISEQFELKVKTYFVQTLYKLYHEASDTRSAYKNIENFHKAEAEFKAKETSGFSGNVERMQAKADLEKKQEAAEKAQRKIERYDKDAQDNVNPLTRKVREIVREAIIKKEEPTTESENPVSLSEENNLRGNKPRYLADNLSCYDRKTRKVVSLIYDVIQQTAPEIATELIANIHETLLASQKD